MQLEASYLHNIERILIDSHEFKYYSTMTWNAATTSQIRKAQVPRLSTSPEQEQSGRHHSDHVAIM